MMMSILVLIRHGQASFGSSDYDQLSDLGARQAHTLGVFEGRHLEPADRMYVGPLRRHQQTAQGYRQGFREQRDHPLPEPSQEEGLCEHALLSLLSQHRAEVVAQSETLRAFVQTMQDAPDPHRWMRQLLFEVAYQWIEGKIDIDAVEPWTAFRRRVAHTIDALTSMPSKGERVLAFTSGGFMGAAVGHLLELDDRQTFELGTELRNTSLVEIRFSTHKKSLSVYNAIPHLTDPTLVTHL